MYSFLYGAIASLLCSAVIDLVFSPKCRTANEELRTV